MEHAAPLADYTDPDRARECAREPDERALVVAAQRDPAAFDSLYERYFPRIYRYLRLRTSRTEDAADLTQQTFLQALAALPRYQQRETPFAAWLFRIAHNLATNAARHRQDRQTVDWDLIAGTFVLHGTSAAATESNPEAALLRQEAHARLSTLLRGLHPAKRELLALRFGAGLTVREIALVVGKSEAAVHKQIARILQGMKEQYNED